VHEIVIVVLDLFLPPSRGQAPGASPTQFGALPGVAQVGRFGTRRELTQGWRDWLTERLGRSELSELSPAAVAAAALSPPPASSDAGSLWIATPLALSAGLTRVHLEHGAILRLLPAEQAVLAADFRRTFGGGGAELIPLPAGEFLLRAPEVPAVPTVEPQRCAGQDVAHALPAAASASALRRLLAELEMWLHAHPLNDARRQRGALPPTTLWLWGAEGRMMRAEPAAAARMGVLAYGRDAWLDGLMSLLGGGCRTLPEQFVAERMHSGMALWALEVGGELQRTGQGTAGEAMVRLDARFIVPALTAVRAGAAGRLTLILNDVAISVTRRSRWRLWRRAGPALEPFR
jgi:hypothetical protein